MFTDKRPRTVAGLAQGLSWVVVCVLALACHGGGDGDNESPLGFRCTDSPVAVDTVALACGNPSQNAVREVQVILGGLTTSTDIMGFNFDVVFDPANVSYVAGSASQGTLLSSDGDDPLLAVSLASNDPGRLLVGIHRTNQPGGVAGTGSRNLVLRFSLKTTSPLMTFGPDLPLFENAEALDSSGAAIPGITFSNQMLLSVN